MTALRLLAALFFVGAGAVPLTGTDTASAQKQQNAPQTEETGRPTEVEIPDDDTYEQARP